MMMVVDAIRQLGADPTAQTPCADLVGVESMGLVQAMNDPRTSLVQSLHVMLDAELLDNAGWEMLIDLANRSGHADIAKQFAVALQQEARHLAHVRALVERLTAEELARARVLIDTEVNEATCSLAPGRDRYSHVPADPQSCASTCTRSPGTSSTYVPPVVSQDRPRTPE